MRSHVQIFFENLHGNNLKELEMVAPISTQRDEIAASISNKGEVEKYFGLSTNCMTVHPPKASHKRELSGFGN